VRTTLYVVLLGTLVIIADVSYQSAERIRVAARLHSSDRLRVFVEDWEFPIYLAVGLAVCAVGWLAAGRVTSSTAFGRFVRPPAVGGTIGAVIGGVVVPLALVVLSLLAGQGTWMAERLEWESRWLMGSALGAVAGMAIGGGLGLVACLTPVQPHRDTAERN
jgi:hypothetical protein